MRIVLDECRPAKLARTFSGHEVTTVSALGWSGIRNGELLTKLEQEGYELLVTVDKNLRYQQKIEGRSLAVLVLDSQRNTLTALIPHVQRVLAELATMSPGNVYIR